MTFDHPSMSLILSRVSEHLNILSADIRLGRDEPATAAAGLFGWLARQLTRHGMAAAALFIGRGVEQLARAVEDVDRWSLLPQRAALLDSLMIEICALHRIAVEGQLPVMTDADPDAAAERIMASDAGVTLVSTDSVRALASAYRSLRLSAEQPKVVTQVVYKDRVIRAPSPPAYPAAGQIADAARRLAEAQALLEEAKFTRKEAEHLRRRDAALHSLCRLMDQEKEQAA